MAWSYERALKFLETARDPWLGKPVENNTRVIMYGERECPYKVTVKHHNTNIVTFWPDGRIDVVPWDSMSTKARIWTYAGVYLHNHRLPAINGRRPFDHSVLAFRRGWHDTGPIVNGRDMVSLHADGRIDLDSVTPLKIDVVTNQKAANVAMKHFWKILQTVMARQLFEVEPGPEYLFDWLTWNFHKPIAEMDFARLKTVSEKMNFDYHRFEIAKVAGCAKTIELKIFPTSAVVI